LALEAEGAKGRYEQDGSRWEMKATTTTRKSRPESSWGKPGHFFYSCPALDIWSLGATRKEAERNLREELLLLLMRCSRYDELDYFLMDNCFAMVEVHPS
jgi:hypothetical protein